MAASSPLLLSGPTPSKNTPTSIFQRRGYDELGTAAEAWERPGARPVLVGDEPVGPGLSQWVAEPRAVVAGDPPDGVGAAAVTAASRDLPVSLLSSAADRPRCSLRSRRSRKALAGRADARQRAGLVFEEPELHVIDFSAGADEWRAERARQEAEGRRRYLARLEMTLIGLGADAEVAGPWAAAILDGLFRVVPVDGGEPCICSCHPRLPASDLHDYGFGCSCQRTVEERRRFWDGWKAKRDAYWASPEGREERARRQAEEDELVAWLVGQPDVVVTTHGGWAPEQWRGSVEGRKFYFRERHDQWRIELDLRPSGRFSKVWKGGPLDDEESFELDEIEEGDVIAEGVVGVPGYGTSPVERARFIVGTIRRKVEADRCPTHRDGRAVLGRRLGVAVRWCPACGADLAADGSGGG